MFPLFKDWIAPSQFTCFPKINKLNTAGCAFTLKGSWPCWISPSNMFNKFRFILYAVKYFSTCDFQQFVEVILALQGRLNMCKTVLRIFQMVFQWKEHFKLQDVWNRLFTQSQSVHTFQLHQQLPYPTLQLYTVNGYCVCVCELWALICITFIFVIAVDLDKYWGAFSFCIGMYLFGDACFFTFTLNSEQFLCGKVTWSRTEAEQHR